jgi:hypothetical protein
MAATSGKIIWRGEMAAARKAARQLAAAKIGALAAKTGGGVGSAKMAMAGIISRGSMAPGASNIFARIFARRLFAAPSRSGGGGMAWRHGMAARRQWQASSAWQSASMKASWRGGVGGKRRRQAGAAAK